jgi:hypothetical protein
MKDKMRSKSPKEGRSGQNDSGINPGTTGGIRPGETASVRRREFIKNVGRITAGIAVAA